MTMLAHANPCDWGAKSVPKILFTDLSVRSFKPGLYFDTKTPNFGLRVGKNRRTWLIVREPNRTKVTLGTYPEISVADARTAARIALTQKTPAAEQAEAPKAKPITFGAARAKYIAEHKGRPRTIKGLKRYLTKHFGKLDERELPAITDDDVARRITGLKPSEAFHAFCAVRAFLRWCVKRPRRYIPHSPLEGYDAPHTSKLPRTRILSDEEVRRVLGAISGQCGALAMLMLLWGTRKGETLALRRDWVSDGRITIPAAFTKNARPLTIPILPMAQGVLDSLTVRGPFFFPARWSDDDHLDAGSWTKLHKALLTASETSGWSAHDLRRTFRSACARFGVPREIAERLLNHAQGKLDAIYDQYDYAEEKRSALGKIETWLTKLQPPARPLTIASAEPPAMQAANQNLLEAQRAVQVGWSVHWTCHPLEPSRWLSSKGDHRDDAVSQQEGASTAGPLQPAAYPAA